MSAASSRAKLFTAAIIGLALGIFSTAPALELSAGGGGVFATSFDGGNTSVNYEYDIQSWTGGGFNLFFDATYAELGIGMLFGAEAYMWRFYDRLIEEEWGPYMTAADYNTFTHLNISLYGKYPFSLGERTTIFPMAGAEYQIVLYEENFRRGKIDYADTPHRLWLKFGAGADYSITDKIYIRNAVLYGIGFSNNAEKWVREDTDDVTFDLFHGLTVKIGVGYKF